MRLYEVTAHNDGKSAFVVAKDFEDARKRFEEFNPASSIGSISVMKKVVYVGAKTIERLTSE